MSTRMTKRTWIAVLGVLAGVLASGVALAEDGVARWEVKQEVVAQDAAPAERAARPEISKAEPVQKGAPVVDEQAKKIRVRYSPEHEAKQ